MRRDVLDLMAEEVSQRQADPLASFTTWDGGRRKLDGMSRGKRWDIDREQRAFEKDNERELSRLMKLRSRRRKPEVYRAHSRRSESANKVKRAAQRKRRYWKNRTRMLAKLKASRKKHAIKRRAEALAYYYDHRDEQRANQRAWSAKNRPPTGKRGCSACRLPGHNIRRCPSRTVPPPPPTTTIG